MVNWGQLGLLGLTVACSAHVRDLGHDTGGSASTSGFGSTGGSESTGGFGPTETGGFGPTTTGGSSGATPYVLDPTLPIDPSCTCDSPDKICNAARQCVPRCDSAGRCALWLANRAVKDLYLDGSTLYYATAAGTDPLGNPAKNGSLYSVDFPDGTPKLIATGFGDPKKIIGRYAGATYLGVTSNAVDTMVAINDAGSTATLDVCGSNGWMRGKWLACTSNDNLKLMSVDLDGRLAPQLLVDLTLPAGTVSDSNPQPVFYNVAVLDDIIWYGVDRQVCSIQLSNVSLPPTCISGGGGIGGHVFGTDGTILYVAFEGSGAMVWAYDTSGQLLLTLYTYKVGGSDYRSSVVYSHGWLYTAIWFTATVQAQFVRFPATTGRLPQEVLPREVASPAMCRGSIGTGSTYNDIPIAAGLSDFFWTQWMTDMNQPQYIFHAPLPPQPCDAELPCADSTLVCKDGYCSAP
jgi:hypothetical protein